LLLVSLSVWDDLQSLQHFVYKTSHVELLRATATPGWPS
jgi:hypothetical protein